MKHLMTILTVQAHDADGTLLWEQENIKNVLHVSGQEFILKAVFNTAAGVSIPTTYYVGLDARPAPDEDDTPANLAGEPIGNSYQRAAVPSATGFTVTTTNGVTQATSTPVVFTGTGAGWGPIKNIFLATSTSNTGYLLATAQLGQPYSASGGQKLSMQIGIRLKDSN